jgi:hypothetical protein
MQKVANYCVRDALNRQKVSVKLFLCFTEHHTQMMYRITEVQLHPFVNSLCTYYKWCIIKVGRELDAVNCVLQKYMQDRRKSVFLLITLEDNVPLNTLS